MESSDSKSHKDGGIDEGKKKKKQSFEYHESECSINNRCDTKCFVDKVDTVFDPNYLMKKEDDSDYKSTGMTHKTHVKKNNWTKSHEKNTRLLRLDLGKLI